MSEIKVYRQIQRLKKQLDKLYGEGKISEQDRDRGYIICAANLYNVHQDREADEIFDVVSDDYINNSLMSDIKLSAELRLKILQTGGQYADIVDPKNMREFIDVIHLLIIGLERLGHYKKDAITNALENSKKEMVKDYGVSEKENKLKLPKVDTGDDDGGNILH